MRRPPAANAGRPSGGRPCATLLAGVRDLLRDLRLQLIRAVRVDRCYRRPLRTTAPRDMTACRVSHRPDVV